MPCVAEKLRLIGLAEMDGVEVTVRATAMVCEVGVPEGVLTVMVPL